jgi:hypothetical protein
MPIDVAAVNWAAVAVLSAMAFVASFIGSLFIRNPFAVAVLTAVLFAVIYVAWTYYPHGYLAALPRPR